MDKNDLNLVEPAKCQTEKVMERFGDKVEDKETHLEKEVVDSQVESVEDVEKEVVDSQVESVEDVEKEVVDSQVESVVDVENEVEEKEVKKEAEKRELVVDEDDEQPKKILKVD